MSTIRKLVMSAVLVGQLAACAGRDPMVGQPVAMPSDQQLDCNALNAEIYGNTVKVQSLKSEEDSKRGQNIAMGVVGALIFWPALFAMDFKDAAGTDRKAVEARLQYLQALAMQKSCATPQPVAGWKDAPVRADVVPGRADGAPVHVDRVQPVIETPRAM